MNPRQSKFSPAEMDSVSFECMEVISSGTEAVTKLAFNWARQGQSATMALMVFTTKMPDKFTVSKEFQTLANQQHIFVCIVDSRRAEGRMVHRRYEFVPRTYAHHRHGQWSDGASGIPSWKRSGIYLAAFLQAALFQMECAWLPALMRNLTTPTGTVRLKFRRRAMSSTHMCLPL